MLLGQRLLWVRDSKKLGDGIVVIDRALACRKDYRQSLTLHETAFSL
jgi:hypothetical protein